MNRCSHDACVAVPSFNVKGSKGAAFCKKHAEDGMVNVRSYSRCSSDACMTLPRFNVKGSKRPAFCKNHALDGMVNLRGRGSSRDDRVGTRGLDENDGQAAAKRGRQTSPARLFPAV
ncbi:unnamed protein product [Laminaria digitata]